MNYRLAGIGGVCWGLVGGSARTIPLSARLLLILQLALDLLSGQWSLGPLGCILLAQAGHRATWIGGVGTESTFRWEEL